LWLYSRCGIVKIDRSALDRWRQQSDIKLTVEVFDKFDGAHPHGVEHANQPNASKTSDGRLWFINMFSAQVIDPKQTYRNPLPPPVHIEKVIADHKDYGFDDRLRLPALTRDVEIDYTALSLAVAQKVRFRYELEGHDAEWQEAATRRQAFYTNLSPGKYRFRVMACNNSGVWNEAGTFLDFSIAPAYYQTTWFRVSCVAAFLVLFCGLFLLRIWVLRCGLYRLRIRELRHEFAVGLEARVNERTRIARELHDTLLQSFQGLMLRFQTVGEMLPARPLDCKNLLEGALDRADEAMSEDRDAITDIRATTLASRDLEKSITALMTNLSEGFAPGNGR